MSNIEKIRQEIERLKNIAENNNASEYLRGQARVCRVILSFIDSLPEETCKDSLQVPETCKENTDSFTSLEEAAEKYADGEMMSGLAERAFIAGGEWQKEQMMKDAVEVDVADLNGEIYNNCIEKGMTDEDKVKIVIVKQDE